MYRNDEQTIEKNSQSSIILMFSDKQKGYLKQLKNKKLKLPSYIQIKKNDKTKYPDWLKKINIPANKQATIMYNPHSLEKCFEPKGSCYSLSMLDMEFQLPEFGQNKNVLLFHNDSVISFENSEYKKTSAVVHNAKTLKKMVKQQKPMILHLDDMDETQFLPLISYLEMLHDSGKLLPGELFSADIKRSSTKSGFSGMTMLRTTLSDSAAKRCKRSVNAKKLKITNRELIADMTGTAILCEDDTCYTFKAGALSRIKTNGKITADGLKKIACIKSGKTKIESVRESSFSFEGDYARGIRECLIFKGPDVSKTGRITTDQFLMGDHKGLFVSIFADYPVCSIDFYDSISVWELELGSVRGDTEIQVIRKISDKKSEKLNINEEGTYHLPADDLYLKAGSLQIGFKILQSRKDCTEIFSVTISKVRKWKEITISILGSTEPVHTSEYNNYCETLSFCLYPGSSESYTDIPPEYKKETYPARSWKKD